MKYNEPIWRCPYCVHMQNMSQQSQTGNPNPPYMIQPDPDQAPYFQSDGWDTGMQRDMGRRPGAGMQPNMGMQPGMGMKPDMGMQPGMGMQPDMGMQPNMGMQPDIGTQPGMGMQPDTEMWPGVGMQPETGMQHGGTPERPQMNMPLMGPGPQIPPYMSPSGMPYEQPVPFHQVYGSPASYLEEQENERDMQRLKEMYPEVAKKLLTYVEEECDKMEYDGSMMFDETPDRIMILKIVNDIYDKVKDQFDLPEEEDKDEMFAMNRETRRRYPPRKNWLGDMINVLLFQEMHRRRCRHRNCRGWY